MSIAKLGAALVVSVVSLIASLPANAASPVTDAFLANVRPNIEFLDRSSRIAADQASATEMRTFARQEVVEVAPLSSAIGALSPSDHRFAMTAVSSNADGLMTGRSARIETDAKPAGFGQSANARMPLGSLEVARLTALSGRAFDDLYWEKQLDALSQLRADYRQYIAEGDDAELLAIARRELPKVENRLLLLSKI